MTATSFKLHDYVRVKEVKAQRHGEIGRVVEVSPFGAGGVITFDSGGQAYFGWRALEPYNPGESPDDPA